MLKTLVLYVYVELSNCSRFGNKGGKLIAPVEGTSGNDRFYIMALEDVNSGTYYYWYAAAFGKLNNTVGDTTNDFGKGKANTADVMNKWINKTWGAQNAGLYKDMWGAVQQEINKKKANKDKGTWFIASKSEWAAFGDMTTKKLGLTTSNYSSYGLKPYYWYSSQYNTNLAYYADFNGGDIGSINVSNGNYVRLCETF